MEAWYHPSMARSAGADHVGTNEVVIVIGLNAGTTPPELFGVKGRLRSPILFGFPIAARMILMASLLGHQVTHGVAGRNNGSRQLVVALAKAVETNRKADAFFRRLEDNEG